MAKKTHPAKVYSGTHDRLQELASVSGLTYSELIHIGVSKISENEVKKYAAALGRLSSEAA